MSLLSAGKRSPKPTKNIVFKVFERPVTCRCIMFKQLNKKPFPSSPLPAEGRFLFISSSYSLGSVSRNGVFCYGSTRPRTARVLFLIQNFGKMFFFNGSIIQHFLVQWVHNSTFSCSVDPAPDIFLVNGCVIQHFLALCIVP